MEGAAEVEGAAAAEEEEEEEVAAVAEAAEEEVAAAAAGAVDVVRQEARPSLRPPTHRASACKR